MTLILIEVLEGFANVNPNMLTNSGPLYAMTSLIDEAKFLRKTYSIKFNEYQDNHMQIFGFSSNTRAIIQTKTYRN